MVLPAGIKKKENQSKGKHDGRPEAQPNKQGHGGSKHHQSTQPAWCGGARLCKASCRKAFLQKAQQVTLQVTATNPYKDQRTARKM